jgi:hypothetical protein
VGDQHLSIPTHVPGFQYVALTTRGLLHPPWSEEESEKKSRSQSARLYDRIHQIVSCQRDGIHRVESPEKSDQNQITLSRISSGRPGADSICPVLSPVTELGEQEWRKDKINQCRSALTWAICSAYDFRAQPQWHSTKWHLRGLVSTQVGLTAAQPL